MRLNFLKSKIHRATVTEANLNYQGSITLGKDVLEAAQIHPFEQVDVYNITNGERFTTYAIEGESGGVCLNGAAAWKVRVGDKIIIACYCSVDESEVKSFNPKLVFVDDYNKIFKISAQIESKEFPSPLV